MVIRSPRRVVAHATPTIMLSGTQLKVPTEAIYLGCLVHETKWFKGCCEHMASKARKALWAMLAKVKSMNVVAIETQCRLFDTLVTSVGSYACQIWGVDHLKFRSKRDVLGNPFQKVQFLFLRMISGCSQTVCRWSLLKEFGVMPVQVKWACLCARFWNTHRNESHIEYKIFKADILLFSKGSDTCWTAKFLSCMCALGLTSVGTIGALRLLNVEHIRAQRFSEGSIIEAFQHAYEKLWPTVIADPRTAPSLGLAYVRYYNWCFDKQSQHHKHLSSPIPGHHIKSLLRFRLGCTPLKVHTIHDIPRDARTCPICTSGLVDDEQHMLFECHAFDSYRTRFSHSLFHATSVDMNMFLNQNNQRDVAYFIHILLSKRKNLLNLAR
jgi:hypothetical protein